MVAKKKLKRSAANGADDYKLKYDDLVQRVMRANGEKKKLLMNIADDVGKLLKGICDPDPPGCSGPPPPGKFEDVVRRVQKANAAKKARLKNISSDIDKLLQKICDPDPPGCSSIKFGGTKSR
jgi:hypothetical protein